MKAPAGALALALLSVHRCAAVTPVQKVIEMLRAMEAKAKEEKHLEQVQWAAYSQWCSDSENQKQIAVKRADVVIETLDAEVKKQDSEAERLGAAVVERTADVAGYEESHKNATAMRKEERKTYEVTRQDLSESVQALNEAVQHLKLQAYDRPQAEADAAMLLQQVRGALPSGAASARRVLEDYLATPAERSNVAFIAAAAAGRRGRDAPGDAAAGVALGYEFQSGGVVTMLEELHDKFKSELNDHEANEADRNNAYERLAQDLTAQKKAGNSDIAKFQTGHAAAKKASAEASAQLSEVSAARADDAKFLDDLAATCKEKSVDFEARQKLRDEEMQALTKAIEIISADAVSGAAKEHLPALVQRRATALPQLRRGARRAPDDGRERAAQLLEGAGAKLGSRDLSMLAGRVRDSSDPFAKVKTLIEELLMRLKQEETNEKEHKGWCDTELGTNLQTRETKTQAIEVLKATIDELESRIGTLKIDIGRLSEAIATIDAELVNATALRKDEKDHNEDVIADAAGAQIAVGEAIKTLKDFYDGAEDATALVQEHRQSRAGQPAIFDSPYKGQQTESGNVVAFLEVVHSDFARLESDTQTAEQAAAAEYDQLVEDARTDKAEKQTSVKAFSAELATKEGDLTTAGGDLEMTEADLNAALEYFEKLKPTCVGGGQSYEDRVARREEELEALKEALAILSGETPLGGPSSLYSSTQGGNLGWDAGA